MRLLRSCEILLLLALMLLIQLVVSFVLPVPDVPCSRRRLNMISSGFSFGDGEQILVSVQKPLGLLLEQVDEEDNNSNAVVYVAEILPDSSAARAGVQPGDVIVAVQNADMRRQSLETVMECIGKAPKVVNLRFQRLQAEGG